VTGSHYEIKASLRRDLLRALGPRVSSDIARLVAADPYDWWAEGGLRPIFPAVNELVRFAEGTAGTGDPRLKVAVARWLRSQLSDFAVLAQHESQLSRVPLRERRKRARHYLEGDRDGAADVASLEKQSESDERIVGLGDIEDRSGNVALPFEYPITSETHFRSDRWVVTRVRNSRGKLTALCVPCFGKVRCPEECPAESGRCGKDFMGYFVDKEKARGAITGPLGGAPPADPVKELERLAEKLKGKPLTREVLKAAGLRGKRIAVARTAIEKMRREDERK
jgi:hypothetical protein